jgi:hypothetical protein
MKTLITIFASLVFSLFISAQQQSMYVCGGSNTYNVGLLKLDAATCDSIFVGYTDSIILTDIAITSDHKLYGIDGTNLYEIDTSNGHLTIIRDINALHGINSLVADSAGNLITVHNDSLYQINRFIGQYFSLGYIGYGSAGDLTFYNDTLYLAGRDTCCSTKLIQIILSPLSAHAVGTMNAPNLYGINTVCINNVETMIATGGGLYNSNLYLVNPATASLTLLCDTIIHELINGAASIYDINGGGAASGCTAITGLLNAQAANDRVDVFPNPFTNRFTVSTNTNEESEIILFDVTSRELLRRSFVNSATINTEQLSRGIYFYEIKDKDGVVARGKVIKQ